jgi:hypothetical protein
MLLQKTTTTIPGKDGGKLRRATSPPRRRRATPRTLVVFGVPCDKSTRRHDASRVQGKCNAASHPQVVRRLCTRELMEAGPSCCRNPTVTTFAAVALRVSPWKILKSALRSNTVSVPATYTGKHQESDDSPQAQERRYFGHGSAACDTIDERRIRFEADMVSHR